MTIKKAGDDEGHPAPSQEPHGWASFFRRHRACHGYRTSRAQSGSGYLTFGECAGMSPQQPCGDEHGQYGSGELGHVAAIGALQ
jgi:hypothetical protein